MDQEWQLQIGDRVGLSYSTIQVTGVVTEELDRHYVRVQWADSSISTTHHRHSLVLENYPDGALPS